MIKKIGLPLVILATAQLTLVAAPSFNPLFSDGAVLQRDCPIPVWGKATPGETITLTLGEHSTTIKANEQGHWKAELPKYKAAGPSA